MKGYIMHNMDKTKYLKNFMPSRALGALCMETVLPGISLMSWSPSSQDEVEVHAEGHEQRERCTGGGITVDLLKDGGENVQEKLPILRCPRNFNSTPSLKPLNFGGRAHDARAG